MRENAIVFRSVERFTSGVERIRQILGKIPFDTHSLSPTPLTHMGGIWNVVISSLGARLLITLSPTRKAKR